MNYRNLINKRIIKNDYKYRQYARICNVSHVSLRNFLEGKNTTFETFLKIITFLEFTDEEKKQLIQSFTSDCFGISLTPTIEEEHSIEYIKKANLRLKELEKSHEIGEFSSKVPIYSSVSAGCGYSPDPIPISWISLGEEFSSTKGVLVEGDSMEPTIKNGATVFFKEVEKLNNKDIGIFILNNEGYIKRYFKDNNHITLTSDNPEYMPIIVSEYDDFKICGKVIKVLTNI